jgi:16S rRNA (adenine1518-N6/adenine1519-N6)-dimethyltransferase
MKHIPRKRFGQNFLTDQSVLDNIIRAINPQHDDLMVEIGPGLGAMTRLLLASLDHLHAVEVDRDLARHLEQTIDKNKLSVHQHDALQFDFSGLIGTQNKKLRVVGNLPYNISSPLLFHLTHFVSQIQDQHFMLQKEVVERMVAEPGSKTYGRLSVMLQWRYHMDLLFIVPPQAFDPPPKVDSAIVRMIPLQQPLACDVSALEQVVTKAFSQRRKVIRNCLSGMFTENDLIDAGVNPQARPEAVPLEQFVGLANRLTAGRH